MKKIKVYLWGERLKDIYPYATKWQVFKWKFKRFIRKVMVFGTLTLIAGIIGIYFFPRTVVDIRKIEVEAKAPVLERIAKCESNNQHMRDGQVLMVGNTNKSVDIGVFQINNKVWGKRASDLGYNLSKEEDNRAFAQYLYKNFGTEPWYPSKKCWN